MEIPHHRLSCVDGIKGQGKIFHNDQGYHYFLNTLRPNCSFAHFRCIHSRKKNQLCPGRASVSLETGLLRQTHIHNHEPDFFFTQELVLRRAIVDRVSNGDPIPFWQIIEEEGQRGRFPRVVRARVTLAKLRTTMRNARLANLPPIPRNLGVLGALLALPQYAFISRTIDDEDNIFAGMCGNMGDGTLSVVFISRRMCDFMSTRTKVFSDGTFKSRPNEPESSQIFSVVTLWRHHVIPLLRAFMLRRTLAAYRVLIQHIKQIMPEFNPQVIMCDHEKAEVRGWKEEYPHARVLTCLWHFAKAVANYARELGLVPIINEFEEVQSIVRSACAIPLAPPEKIAECFMTLGWEARLSGWMPVLQGFFMYLITEWLPRGRSLSVFGAADRTNNACETSNNSLNEEVKVVRPNVWQVIGALTREEDKGMVAMHTLAEGGQPGRKRKTSALANDARIAAVSQDLLQGDITSLQFLHVASRRLQGTFQNALG